MIVNTKLGKVQGSILQTWKGNKFHAFRGIPYAKPPIDELRFKDPVPHAGWEDVFNATEDGPMAPQPRKSSLETSEDCLRINVYTKSPNTSTRRPVLVYIHGGGLYVGSSVSTDMGGPQYLMEHDIVLVTFNYRLSFLGFFNLGTKEYPGNAGLKDQVLALRWVQNNIKYFGGDPQKVTLIGNSAGAMCVTLHMISPMSEGLFHQAIIASGGINFQTPVGKHQRDLIDKGAKLLGIVYQNDEELIQGFKNTTTEKLVETLYENFEYGRDNPIFLWSFVVEDDFGQERFLVADPRLSLANGKFMRIPIIAGVTENELMTSAIDVIKDSELLQKFDQDFESVAPICFCYEKNTQKSIETSQVLREKYKIPRPISTPAETLEKIGQLFSDAVIGFSNHRVVEILRKDNPVFQYKFSYTGRYSFLCYPGDKPYGAEHCDDFIYLFVYSRYMPVFTKTDPESEIIDRMTKFVANFVTSGSPTPLNYDTENSNRYVVWKQSSCSQENYLKIGNDGDFLEQGLFKERYQIWDDLFPLDDFIENP